MATTTIYKVICKANATSFAGRRFKRGDSFTVPPDDPRLPALKAARGVWTIKAARGVVAPPPAAPGAQDIDRAHAVFRKIGDTFEWVIEQFNGFPPGLIAKLPEIGKAHRARLESLFESEALRRFMRSLDTYPDRGDEDDAGEAHEFTHPPEGETCLDLEAHLEALDEMEGVNVTAHDGVILLVNATPKHRAVALEQIPGAWIDLGWVVELDAGTIREEGKETSPAPAKPPKVEDPPKGRAAPPPPETEAPKPVAPKPEELGDGGDTNDGAAELAKAASLQNLLKQLRKGTRTRATRGQLVEMAVAAGLTPREGLADAEKEAVIAELRDLADQL